MAQKPNAHAGEFEQMLVPLLGPPVVAWEQWLRQNGMTGEVHGLGWSEDARVIVMIALPQVEPDRIWKDGAKVPSETDMQRARNAQEIAQKQAGLIRRRLAWIDGER